jgi:hypothetical protein
VSPTIQLDLTGMVGGQLAPLTVDPAAAAHEARHLAASATLGYPDPHKATAIPNPSNGWSGITCFDDPFTITDDELTTDERRATAIVLTAGGLGEPGWPPDFPSILEPKCDDEWKFRVIVDRLGDNEEHRREVWESVKAEAIRLAASPEFQLLAECYERLLLDGHTLTRDVIREVSTIASTKGLPMDLTSVQASTRTIEEQCGAFMAIMDRKRRGHDMTAVIASKQAADSSNPILDLTGTTIGTADPRTLQQLGGLGISFRGQLHLETSQAEFHFEYIHRNRVEIGYADDLSSIVIYPLVDEHKSKPVPTDSDLLDMVTETLADPGERVDPLDVIQVELDAGLIDPGVAAVKIEMINTLRSCMSCDHAPTREVLRELERSIQ